MKYFRRQLNPVIKKLGVQLQLQSYDHVLQEDAREKSAFEDVAEYIARNPERKSLIQLDGYATYPYTGCLVPGYPELALFEPDYWTRFWRVYSHLLQNGFHAIIKE
ncbi:MAG: hypothetical protein R3C03_16995 [Pirellulaceae bacterium]